MAGLRKSTWTRVRKTLTYRPHESLFCANTVGIAVCRLSEPCADDRPVFRPHDNSAAGDRFGHGPAPRPVLSNAADGADATGHDISARRNDLLARCVGGWCSAAIFGAAFGAASVICRSLDLRPFDHRPTGQNKHSLRAAGRQSHSHNANHSRYTRLGTAGIDVFEHKRRQTRNDRLVAGLRRDDIPTRRRVVLRSDPPADRRHRHRREPVRSGADHPHLAAAEDHRRRRSSDRHHGPAAGFIAGFGIRGKSFSRRVHAELCGSSCRLCFIITKRIVGQCVMLKHNLHVSLTSRDTRPDTP